MFEQTISELKAAALIKETDIAVVCTDTPSPMASIFGAIGAAIAASKTQAYILSANENEIKLFDIDRKTCRYNNSFSLFTRENIKKLSVAGLGGKNLVIKSTDGTTTLTLPYKFRGEAQKPEVLRLAEFLKKNYK